MPTPRERGTALTITAATDTDTRAAGERIGRRLEPGAVLLLRGPLGAGKTTLAKGIARGLGVRETVTSPTYTIVSDYEGRLPLHHIDLYRISGSEEYEMLGLEELFSTDAVCLIEWPERAGGPIPGATATIDIRIAGDGTRLLTAPDTLISPDPEASARERPGGTGSGDAPRGRGERA
ncbi:MAG: tRNA (adenosine(37)-N6)-threonylcarbamoyltransferase complex ATPase subunit type 1 TsaE [Spirochaetota bacterium]